MNNKKLIYGFVAIIFIALFLFYFLSDIEAYKKNKVIPKKTINWKEKYSPQGKSPYDTYLFYELLKKYTIDKKLKFNEITNKLEKPVNKSNIPAIYVTVCKDLYLPYDNCSNIKEFVEEGNFAFVAAETLPYDLSDIISDVSLEISHNLHFKTELNFTDTNLVQETHYKFRYYYNRIISLTDWWYFDSLELNTDEEVEVKEYIDTVAPLEDSITGLLSAQKEYKVLEINENKHPVFIKIPYGKGAFYFHSVPLCFTNISMLKERNVQHAEKLLSHLPDGNIIWDKYAALEIINQDKQTINKIKESPLQFILRNPPLRWAFYTMLSAVALYLLFRSKRKQSIIPPVEEKKNTSVEFAQILSGIYLQQHKHKSIALQMRKIWLHYIREKYFLSITDNNPVILEILARKSGVDKEKIFTLHTTFEKMQNISHTSREELINLHQQLEYFYNNCN